VGIPLRRALSNLVALAIVTSILASAGIYLYAEVVKSYSMARSSSEVIQPLLRARCWNIASTWICAAKAISYVEGDLRVLTARGEVVELGNVSIEPNEVMVFEIPIQSLDEPVKLILLAEGRAFLYDIER